jgi:hypothetical protein
VRDLSLVHKDLEFGATKIRTEVEKELLLDYEEEQLQRSELKEG